MKLDHIKARIKKDLEFLEERARVSDSEMSEETLQKILMRAKAYYYVHEAQEKIIEDMGMNPYSANKEKEEKKGSIL